MLTGPSKCAGLFLAPVSSRTSPIPIHFYISCILNCYFPKKTASNRKQHHCDLILKIFLKYIPFRGGEEELLLEFYRQPLAVVSEAQQNRPAQRTKWRILNYKAFTLSSKLCVCQISLKKKKKRQTSRKSSLSLVTFSLLDSPQHLLSPQIVTLVVFLQRIVLAPWSLLC